MNKLNIVANGHPRTNNDLTHMQDAIIEVAKAYGRAFANNAYDPVLIAGAQTVSAGGGSFYYTEAFWFIAGEVYYMPQTAPSIDPPEILRVSSTYAAGNPYLGNNIHNIRIVQALSGMTPAVGDVDFLTAIKNIAADNILFKATSKPWQPVHPAGSSSYPQFATGIINATGSSVRYRELGSGEFEFMGSADVGGCAATSTGGFVIINFGSGSVPVTTGTAQYGCVPARYNAGNDTVPVCYSVTNSGILIGHDAGYSLTAGDMVRCAFKFYRQY